MRAQEAARRALAAVARLTILAGAAGCAGNVVVDRDAAPDAPDPAAPDPGEATPNEPPDVVMDDPPGEECFADTTDNTTACCDALLVASFSDNTLFEDPTLATDEEKACCELAATTMDTWTGPGEMPFDYYAVSGCCSTGLVEGSWEVHPSCTPWGPPMPPAMLLPFDLEVLA